jgi:signal transduction histidine kinase
LREDDLEVPVGYGGGTAFSIVQASNAMNHDQEPTSNALSLDSLQAILQKLESNDIEFSGLRDSTRDSLRASMHLLIQNFVSQSRMAEANDQAQRRRFAQFAYGLTHEINNPLANITGRADLLLREVKDPRHQKSLRTIIDSSMRAYEMLAEMMLAIQRPPLRLQPLDLRKPLNTWFSCLTDRMADRNLEWINHIDDDSLWCQADWGAMSEALVTGLRNAIDACQSGDAIEIVAERVDATNDAATDNNGFESQEIRIAILDNGPGLSPDAQRLAWDVYYSGREAGRGLGIGLSKLQRIVEGHRGRVWIDSKPGQGCSLEIRLPWYRRASKDSKDHRVRNQKKVRESFKG